MNERTHIESATILIGHITRWLEKWGGKPGNNAALAYTEEEARFIRDRLREWIELTSRPNSASAGPSLSSNVLTLNVMPLSAEQNDVMLREITRGQRPRCPIHMVEMERTDQAAFTCRACYPPARMDDKLTAGDLKKGTEPEPGR